MKKAVAASFVLGLATAVTDTSCSNGYLIMECADDQIMTVNQASFGQASIPNTCDTATVWGTELAAISNPSGIVLTGKLRAEARNQLETLRIVYDLKNLEKSSSGNFKVRAGSCAEPGEVIGSKGFKTSFIGWARDSAITDIPGYSAEELEGSSVWIHDADGNEIACGTMGTHECNSVDKTATVKEVCDGLQACLFEHGTDVVPQSYGCSTIHNHLSVDYECKSIITSGPTPEPSPFPAWVPPPTTSPSMIAPQPTPLPTFPPVEPGDDEAAGFDFGGCSGQGTFDVSLVQGNSAVLGQLPANVVGLRIQLAANGDVDINLYDNEDTSSFHEGEAVIRWCDEKLLSDSRYNCGPLGQQPSVETLDYKGSTFTYSGYNGVGGDTGDEYVEVAGVTPAVMTIAAFAYADGEGTVSYSYTGLDTPCCQGLPDACSGSFRATVAKGEVTQLGEIPRGKKDLRVSLESLVDIDIQLYNVEKTQQFDEGEAIVAYCDPPPCNYGAITAATVSSNATYEGMQLEYSGWEGVRGFLGSEYIQITGETTRVLSMGLLGFEAGSARVDYTYTEVAGQIQ